VGAVGAGAAIDGDLGGWNLRRMVWVADRGFASAANRAYLTRGGGHYLHAEKLRHTNTEAAAALARPGRYHTVRTFLRPIGLLRNPCSRSSADTPPTCGASIYDPGDEPGSGLAPSEQAHLGPPGGNERGGSQGGCRGVVDELLVGVGDDA
jgi:hypothetical protein